MVEHACADGSGRDAPMTMTPRCVDCGGPVPGEVVVVVFGDNATGVRAYGYAHPAGSPDCARAPSAAAGRRRRRTAATVDFPGQR
ncbi:hypothetical protein [Streptomyces sp. NPDC060198]|uniref:hypothetical protein n=1 Tax=Streptomyces sp. NPDC060198 TaxID=3347070 RepID=UPI0036487737